MKCMVAAVILALAVVSEAGLLPYGGWPYAHLAAPTVIQSNVLAHPYGAISHAAIHAAYAPHAAILAAPHAAYLGAPHAAILAAPQGPAASVAHHAGVVPGATSVTATRGAVHVAPLPGHAVSQQQLNLAPAPGTI
ncbi:adult cuticle protein 1-like [Anopheles stephensi]|uniref:adult cuticle protein 1-like n=1 Tax=Anopheles stephensi TaxID=30069 RepID=UPI00165881BD|nr:adult cuticle protein 1-like [Anopheles stephensi]